MIADLDPQWTWRVLPPLLAEAMKPIDPTPLPEWAAKNVFLNSRITTKPGFYDVEEFPWTYDFQEMIRTRTAWEITAPDGATIICAPCDEAASQPVTQITWKKASVAGVTESALNGIRWIAKNDPQNVIYSIDSRTEAGNINEVRLQTTLRQLGEQIFTDRHDDAGKYLLKLKRMLIYFMGSYSAAMFANKMAELVVCDELEEHGKISGDTSSTENARSRLKSAMRPLLILMSKPKLAGGPIDREHADGSCHVYEIPCPHCTRAAGGIPSGYQELVRENLRFDHCKDLTGYWDKERVLAESYFQCIHDPSHKIEEHSKRWFNRRGIARWRRTNFNASPKHISFHISDYYGYHPEASWGSIALKIIKAKGSPVAMQGILNHHDGLAWEQRATRTEADDILACRGTYKRGYIPRKPFCLIIGADVGLTDVHWSVLAISRDGEAWVIDWGKELHPKLLLQVLQNKRYPCAEDGKSYRVTFGYIDAKYRRNEVHAACLASGRRLWPIAGINADLAIRSITFNKVPKRPDWFGVTVFIDRDAKHELYTERIQGWCLHRNGATDIAPDAPPLWFPEDLQKGDDFTKQLCAEHLIRKGGEMEEFLPEVAREFQWKRKGANHWGDAVKVALVGYRWITRNDRPALPERPSATKPEPQSDLAEESQ